MCLQFHEEVVQPTFRELFTVRTNIYHDEGRNSYYSHLKNSVLYDFFTEVLEIPRGSVRERLQVPGYIKNLNLPLLSAYVGGLYDAEGHVKKRQAEIDFSTTSQDVWEVVDTTLTRQNIGHSLNRRQRSSLENEIYIYGKDDIAKFDDCVKFTHPVKMQSLSRFLPVH